MLPHAMTRVPSGGDCLGMTGPAAQAFAWYTPVNGADARSLAAWCRAVGPPTVESLPAWSARPLARGDTLLVVAWNVNAGAGDLLELLRREVGYDCDASAAPPPRRHFVLLLQEAFQRSMAVPPRPPGARVQRRTKEEVRAGERLDVIAVARRCGLALVYAPGARNGPEEYPDGREDRGSAILSTLPLSDPVAVELPDEAGRRVAVAATIHSADADSLRLVSVHLATLPRLWRILRTGNSSRARQALALLDAVSKVEAARGQSGARPAEPPWPCETTCPRDFPIATLLAGDLNTWSVHETALRYLLAAFPQSPPVSAEGTRGAFPTDHVLYRRGPNGGELVASSYQRIADAYYSDHHAVVVRFRFSP
jgi:endonuclease/exonuclease/phosphatase family metal-dependent hydrolase